MLMQTQCADFEEIHHVPYDKCALIHNTMLRESTGAGRVCVGGGVITRTIGRDRQPRATRLQQKQGHVGAHAPLCAGPHVRRNWVRVTPWMNVSGTRDWRLCHRRARAWKSVQNVYVTHPHCQHLIESASEQWVCLASLLRLLQKCDRFLDLDKIAWFVFMATQ